MNKTSSRLMINLLVCFHLMTVQTHLSLITMECMTINTSVLNVMMICISTLKTKSVQTHAQKTFLIVSLVNSMELILFVINVVLIQVYRRMVPVLVS